MKTDFNITIPDLPELEEFEFEAYISAIRSHIEKEANWKVDSDAIELGFFSFGKFLIYNDFDIA
jgi:hypothetical protein